MKIYHNPRCSKSREGLALLENSGVEFEVVEYLKDLPTKAELTVIVRKLGIPAEKLVRKSEDAFKENYKDQKLSDEQWIQAMIEHPKLIQRPILISGEKAVIGRPVEDFNSLL
jgi:arsenate reductase